MKLLQYIRILPLLVLVALLSFSVRVGEVWVDLRDSGSAIAQEKVDAQPPEQKLKSAEKAAEEGDAGDAEKAAPERPAEIAAAPDGKGPALPAKEDAQAVEWRDASEEEFSDSDVEEGLYKDLAKRRADLQKRERELKTREALLEATERELDEKIREMTQLRGEIEAMMKGLSEEEQARIVSLVKIYEGMKAKDAARIFNTLDLDVLIEVVSRMSERKSAPIIAEMDEERARTVTILLAEQKAMPVLPPQ